MKRDMDLVRRVLFELEETDDDGDWIDFKLDGVDQKVLSGHIHLMAEAGLIEASDLSDREGPDWKPRRLTWRGHEFLEFIRSQTVWEKTKKAVIEKTGGLALGALEAYARHLVGQLFGVTPTGGSGE